ncbi:hypothetical protein [Streptomyces sp. TRM68367]|nr:hypothetical protein [Streptomyces sp. TRM68367]
MSSSTSSVVNGGVSFWLRKGGVLEVATSAAQLAAEARFIAV